MLNTFTGSPRSSPPAEEWYRCRICWCQRALAVSASFIPGVTAEATISLILRKLLRPLESQGSTMSVWPTFSIRTARFDCQVCSMAPSRFMPQPIGDRQFVPSIVPPCTTVYLCSAVLMFSTWLLATSPGVAFEAQGSGAAAEAAGVPFLAPSSPAEPPAVSRNPSNGSPGTTKRRMIESPGCGKVLAVAGRIAGQEAVPRPACDSEEHRQTPW